MLPKVNIPFNETETVINFSVYHTGEWAEVYTTDKNVMKRYEKYMAKYPDYCKLIKDDKYGMTFSIHPKYAGIYPRAPRKAHFTPEQQEANIERLKQLHK